MLVVHRLAGVLLDVQALDADVLASAVGQSMLTEPSPTNGRWYCEIW